MSDEQLTEFAKAVENLRVAFWDAVAPPLLRMAEWVDRFAKWLARKPM